MPRLTLVSFNRLQQDSDSKIALLIEIWGFLKARKKWWLAPILFLMVLLSILTVLTETSVIAPFIYTLF